MEKQRQELVQKYANLCSQLGEKHYQIRNLMKQSESLQLEIDAVQTAFNTLNQFEQQKAMEEKAKEASAKGEDGKPVHLVGDEQPKSEAANAS